MTIFTRTILIGLLALGATACGSKEKDESGSAEADSTGEAAEDAAPDAAREDESAAVKLAKGAAAGDKAEDGGDDPGADDPTAAKSRATRDRAGSRAERLGARGDRGANRASRLRGDGDDATAAKVPGVGSSTGPAIGSPGALGTVAADPGVKPPASPRNAPVPALKGEPVAVVPGAEPATSPEAADPEAAAPPAKPTPEAAPRYPTAAPTPKVAATPPPDVARLLSLADAAEIVRKPRLRERGQLPGIAVVGGYNSAYFDLTPDKFGLALQVWRDDTTRDTEDRFRRMRLQHPNAEDVDALKPVKGFYAGYAEV